MRANQPTRGALDFAATRTRGIFIAGATAITCGTHIAAICPDPATAARIVNLLNEHCLMDTDELDHLPRSSTP